LQS
ncbi:bacterial extracellular solute-binding s, 5 Middle family protein, partial [Vibrio harveyi]|jgi:molecular chaperone GrpE (heat shock protein)